MVVRCALSTYGNRYGPTRVVGMRPFFFFLSPRIPGESLSLRCGVDVGGGGDGGGDHDGKLLADNPVGRQPVRPRPATRKGSRFGSTDPRCLRPRHYVSTEDRKSWPWAPNCSTAPRPAPPTRSPVKQSSMANGPS